RPESSSWQVPKYEAPAEERQAWINEQLQESDGWMENQPPYKNLSRNLRIFDGILEDKTKSWLVSNGLQYDIKKFVEIISEVREIGYYASEAAQSKPFAEVENKVSKGLYMEAQFPRQVRKALQFATVMGRGYLWPKVKAGDYGFGERKIIFEPLGLLDVMP